MKSLGSGHDIDLALDGKAVTWVAGGGKVKLRRAGRTSTVGTGLQPDGLRPAPSSSRVAPRLGRELPDEREPGRPRPQSRGPMSTCGRSARTAGRGRRTSSPRSRRGAGSVGGDNENGGLTAFAAANGFVWFVNHDSSGSTLFYRNNNSGNIDDLVDAERPQRRSRRARAATWWSTPRDRDRVLEVPGREIGLAPAERRRSRALPPVCRWTCAIFARPCGDWA